MLRGSKLQPAGNRPPFQMGFCRLLIKKRLGKPAAIIIPGADEQNLFFGREIGFSAADLFDSLKATAAEAKGLVLAQATRGRKRKEIQWDASTLARFLSLKEAIDAEYTMESQSDDE